tara:strand:- start:162339 stop:163622 length:1284 start_codon:yes stop_codon:yes gene_type:complete
MILFRGKDTLRLGLATCLLLISIGIISFSFYNLKQYKENLLLKEIDSTEILIDLAKKVNQFSSLVGDEIKFSKKFNFKMTHNGLNDQVAKLKQLKIKNYQIKELASEIKSLISINKNILKHLKDSEEELASKLYKSEFLFHRDQLISLIDSTKKALVIEQRSRIGKNRYEQVFQVLLICLFFISSILFILVFKRHKEFDELRAQELKLHEQVEQLTELKDSESTIKNHLQEKLEILERKYLILCEELKERQGLVNSIEVDANNFHLDKLESKSLDNTSQSLTRFVNEFQKFFQKQELNEINIGQNNETLKKLKSINEKLNTNLINLELNAQQNFPVLNELSGVIKEFKEIQLYKVNADLIEKIQEIKTSLDNVYVDYQNLESHMKQSLEINNENIIKFNSKLFEIKQLLNTINTNYVDERSVSEKFN